jgi:hypothetical protein
LGGAGDDVIVGSAGRDYLQGGTGRDDVRGGDGHDSVIDEGAEADELHGGPGLDLVVLVNEGGPMRVDLAATGQQATGVSDAVTGFESVNTGAGDDVVTGTGGPNTINTFGGDDRVDAGDGDDVLDGGAGRDVLDGGPGADAIDGRGEADVIGGGEGDDKLRASDDFFVDRVDCGTGADEIVTDGSDRLAGCEKPGLRRPARPLRAFNPIERRGRRVRAVYACRDVIDDCRGFSTLRVRHRGRWRSLGRVTFTCNTPAPCQDEARSSWVRLSAPMVRELRRERRLVFQVVTEFGAGRSAGAIALRHRATLRLR